MGAPTREATRPDGAMRTPAPVPTTVPTHAPTTVPMSALRRGDRGRVVLLDPTLPGPVGRRLADLGFVPDADVRCLRRAPLGSPTIYRIGESELCLRRSLSDRILVEPVA